MKSLVQRKKVSLHEIAAPKPSRAATRTVKSALKGAYKDQQAVLKKAYSK